jgi:hypothetical protein
VIGSWAPGEQFEVAKITPELLEVWETIARMESRRIRPGEWNWPMVVRSLIAAVREKSNDPA